MSFLNRLKQRSALDDVPPQQQQNPAVLGQPAGVRRLPPRVPARLLLTNGSGGSGIPAMGRAPLTAPYRQETAGYPLRSPATFQGDHDLGVVSGRLAPGVVIEGGSSPIESRFRHLNATLRMPMSATMAPVSMPTTPASSTRFPGLNETSATGGIPNRTIYLGNVPSDVTPSEILDRVHCGPLEAYRHLPEKECAFIAFINATDAENFYEEATRWPCWMVRGKEIRIAWGKPSFLPQQVQIEVTEHQATRNVFLGDLEGATEQSLRTDLEGYGQIETIRIIPDKRIAFVHFCSIADAIRVVRELSQEPGKRVHYGKDRCAPITNATAAASTPSQEMFAPPSPLFRNVLQPKPYSAALLNSANNKIGLSDSGVMAAGDSLPSPAFRLRSLSARLQPQQDRMDSPMYLAPVRYTSCFPGVDSFPNTPTSATSLAFPPGVSMGEAGSNSRCVYLGGLHVDTTLEDLCNVIRGGGLEEIKMLKDRGIAFVTFLENEAALNFSQRTQREGLMVRGRKLKVGWGHPTPELPKHIKQAVMYSGASRNVYIGGLPMIKPDSGTEDEWTVERVKADFTVFGEVEMVNRPVGMDCAFVNFSHIQSAIRVMSTLGNLQSVGLDCYEKFRLNYGKDRCGNLPKPAAPATPGSAPGSAAAAAMTTTTTISAMAAAQNNNRQAAASPIPSSAPIPTAVITVAAAAEGEEEEEVGEGENDEEGGSKYVAPHKRRVRAVTTSALDHAHQSHRLSMLAANGVIG